MELIIKSSEVPVYFIVILRNFLCSIQMIELIVSSVFVLIIALSELLYEQGMPDMLLKSIMDKFKEKYGVECVAALHHKER